MVLRMQDLEPFARHVGVNGGGRNIRMPKQHLDRPQISAMIQQMGCKCVTQRVR